MRTCSLRRSRPVWRRDSIARVRLCRATLSFPLNLPVEICYRILSGQIDEAIELLKQYFPAVLADNPEMPPLYKSDERLEFIPSTSVKPAHLLLNLQIQGFIEAARSVPLPYHPAGTTPPPSSPPSHNDVADEDKETAAMRAAERLLHRAQNLYAEANRLSNAVERNQYVVELRRVGSLLAYTVPENGPMTQYLGQDRREALAESIDSAILCMGSLWSSTTRGAEGAFCVDRTGQPVVSKLELAARQTSVVWAMLHEQTVKPPPLSSWPAGVTPRRIAKSANPPSSVPSKKSSETDVPEVCLGR